MTTPNWKDALPTCPPGGQLLELWMTTFEPADPGLLADHLFPALFGLHRTPAVPGTERMLYFGELQAALVTLHGRLTIVSSPSREMRDTSTYPWLGRFVDQFIVGAVSTTVQHAKLWAFHWLIGGSEWLELHVTSANLTMPSFKSQVQAGWHTRLQLNERESEGVRRTWGELIPFLSALGVQVGTQGQQNLDRLVRLLGRVQCPEGATFVASVPGKGHAARQLSKLEATKLYVLTPTIGDWNGKTVAAFAADVGIAPSDIQLTWISERHPWARAGFCMTKSAYAELEQSGVRLVCLPNGTRFDTQHVEQDERWSHAKLFALRRRRKRYVLVTSANWSVAAWGAGKVAPRNFELGVLFESEWSALEALEEPFDPPRLAPFCTERDDEVVAQCLEWAEATWDGNRIALRARSALPDEPIAVTVRFEGGAQQEIKLQAHAAGYIQWSDPAQPPFTAVFQQARARLEVPVVDLRTPEEFRKTPLSEVDPALAQAVRDAFLLQRYGGPEAEPEVIAELHRPASRVRGTSPATDYSVQAWRDARAAFRIVDHWRTALAASAGNAARREHLRLDGEELRELFARIGDAQAVAPIVCAELRWRLDEVL